MSNVAEPRRSLTAKRKDIIIERTFDLPVTMIWKAWTDAESLKRWWGPKGYTCTYSNIDLRPGGKYLHCMKSSLGEKFWSTGFYDEITPFKNLVFTDSFSDNQGNMIPAADMNLPGKWPMMLSISLGFEDTGHGTHMILRHEGVPPEMYDVCIKGWNQSFDKLEASLQTLQ
jgi:uncharacterized protein YndB with AHSA1/START domain